jgi:hypothetical protein
MNKNVLISLNPQWCHFLANGEKSIEIRKTKPSIDVPFKCYIYCANKKNCFVNIHDARNSYTGNGKVIGEFVCDKIDVYRFDWVAFTAWGEKNFDIDDITLKKTCLTREQFNNYGISEFSHRENLYGWHISDVKIYDKPKALSEFSRYRYSEKIMDEGDFACYKPDDCTCMDYYDGGDNCFECIFGGRKQITRPPQSWCYVDEE